MGRSGFQLFGRGPTGEELALSSRGEWFPVSAARGGQTMAEPEQLVSIAKYGWYKPHTDGCYP